MVLPLHFHETRVVKEKVMKTSQSKLAVVLLMMFFSMGIYALEDKVIEKPDFNSMIESNARETEGLSHSLQDVYTGDSAQKPGKAVPASEVQVERGGKDRTHRSAILIHET